MKNAFIQVVAPSLADPENKEQLWFLVDKDGNPAVENSPHKDFRNAEDTLVGGTPPHKLGASGYIDTQTGGRYYASVYNLKWVECDELQPAPVPKARPHQAEPIVQVPQPHGGFSSSVKSIIGEPFDEAGFLENLLLDEHRNAYRRMDPTQRAVVRFSYNRGWLKCDAAKDGDTAEVPNELL